MRGSYEAPKFDEHWDSRETCSICNRILRVSLGFTKILYLVHAYIVQGMHVDHKKIQFFLVWAFPTTLPLFRRFFRLYIHERRFVKGLSYMAATLTIVTKKGSLACMDRIYEAFDKHEKVINSCLVSFISDFSQPFAIECDVSGKGVGLVTMQRRFPMEIETRELKYLENDFSMYDNKILVIMHIVAKIKKHLVYGRYMVEKNYNGLNFFLDQHDLNDEKKKGVSKIQFNYFYIVCLKDIKK